MRRLFLIRHAKAQLSTGRDDYRRALIDRGRADARRMARALAARHMLPDVLIHSGARRAKETAEIFSAEWARAELLEEIGLYDASAAALLARARALPGSLANVGFVGHNPGLGELAVSLADSATHSERRRMAAKFPTCAVAVLDFSVRRWSDIELNSAALTLFLAPAELEAGAS